MKSFGLITGTIFVISLSGCDDITIPDSDNTLPSTGCTVVVAGENIVLTSGGNDINRIINADESISIISVGTDNYGGVKSTCIHYSVVITCTNGQYSQQRNLNIAPICSSDNKRPGDKGKTKRVATHVIRLTELAGDCLPGYWMTHIKGTLQATAENYHNGTAETATFTFEVEHTHPNVSIERTIYDERLVMNERVTFKTRISQAEIKRVMNEFAIENELKH